MSVPFTAVVVIHDSEPDLALLFDSLERHVHPPPDVVVVDSGSRDGGAALARRRGADVVVLDGNPGFGAANNAGVARARTDVVALLNPDVELLDAGVLDLVARAHAVDALVVPRLLNADGSVQDSAHPLPGRAGGLVPAIVHPRALPAPVRVRADPWRAARPRTVGWAIAAALVARTETLRALGPFDPDVFLFYEDMDLCLHARALGIRTELHPQVALRHAGAHATRPAFGGEPFELLARRRRATIGARLGARARLLDDGAQALTFATRTLAHAVAGGDAGRPAAQLRAFVRAISAPPRR